MGIVYDCIPFFNEFDLLEIRLNTLKDVVDKFILLELNYTHSLKKRDYVFKQQEDRFKDFPIEYYQLGVNPREHSPAGLMIHQRNMLRACIEPKQGDLILVSDLDEIPDPYKIDGTLGQFTMCMFYFHLNTKAEYKWIRGTLALKGTENRSFHNLRHDTSNNNRIDGGWHFSSVGTETDVLIKMDSFEHIEFSSIKDHVLKNYNSLKDIHGVPLEVVPIDSLFPEYIQRNQEKYSHLIWPLDSTS